MRHSIDAAAQNGGKRLTFGDAGQESPASEFCDVGFRKRDAFETGTV